MADRRRPVRDPDWVLADIAKAAGQGRGTVERVVAALRAVVDDLLADGHVVLLGNLELSMGDSPTRQALLARFAEGDPDWQEVFAGGHEGVAAWLGLPFDVYAERPLAIGSIVVDETCGLLGEAHPGRPVVWDVLEAWDATFADGRAYKVGSVGLEAAAESWLANHLDRLADHGYPVALQYRQYRFPSGRRPDLVCRFVEDAAPAAAGDFLIVELKATRFYPEAADQIEGYLEEGAEHLARSGERMFGLLVTDGADHAEVEELRGLRLGHVSLAALGYRLVLVQGAARSGTPATRSDAPASVPGTSRPTGSALLAWTAESLTSFDGPETYWVRLFFDADSDRADDERDAATALWERRERRRLRYERDYGDPNQWPAAHPTTVVAVDDVRLPVRAAVCIRCDWLARSQDCGQGVDLHEAAKSHALSHPHDPLLERGVNPPKRRRLPARGLDEAAASARRAARRVKLRGTAETVKPTTGGTRQAGVLPDPESSDEPLLP